MKIIDLVANRAGRFGPPPPAQPSRPTRSFHRCAVAGFVAVGLLFSQVHPVPAAETKGAAPAEVFQAALARVSTILQPPADTAPQCFTTTVKILKAGGLPKKLELQELDIACQAPDRLKVSATGEHGSFGFGRNGQQLWVYVPEKKFGLIGSPDVDLYSTAPGFKKDKPLGPLQFALAPEQLAMLPLVTDFEALPNETVGGAACDVIKATIKPAAAQNFKLPAGTFQFWIRKPDALIVRLAYRDGKKADLDIEFRNPQFGKIQPNTAWKLVPKAGDKIETVARAHLTRSLSVWMDSLGQSLPSLGPATGERQLVAREGAGRLEMVDGTKVLFLKGTPEEMGTQHGTLLKKDVRNLVNQILYGVGVGSSFQQGRWVFGEIEAAQKRLDRFMDRRYLREMDALADAAHLRREDVRLANFFPELFHCSGFALYGKATAEGRLYHGRILDYLRGLGLEQNAVVMVMQPEQGNAWVNIGYAGFIGSVTAMNEKHVAIGEMGGKGEGHWDGKPMAELVREVMEKANTLDEAVEIMRQGPRTCEYYYVISDSKSKCAVGIAATPDKFEVVRAGEAFPRLPHAIPDAVLMSAGERYEELARRVQTGYGKFDAASARDLMKRPVCMMSNIHCALFAPDTLDFWVANADAQNVAAHTRFTHYNLAELLKPEPAN